MQKSETRVHAAARAGLLPLALALAVPPFAFASEAAGLHLPASVDPVFDQGFEAFSCSANDDPQPNAGLSEDPGAGGCPAGMIPVETFCIDRHEAALLDFSDPGNPQPWSPYRNPGDAIVVAVSAHLAVPQGAISGEQAAAACQRAGKRLCTDSEWRRACRGPAELIYPYGNTRLPGVCNDARATHPVLEYFGTPPPWTPEQLQHPCINQQFDTLERTGSRDGCISAEGGFDLMGNLHEWTADPAGSFRGGNYVDTQINGNGCLYLTTAHPTSYADYGTGFRCCADP